MLINSYRFGVSDPNFANVSLLLHGDGANGSTTITDSSPSPKTVTVFGNAKISTAIADPFNRSTSGVLAFDGTGDYLSVPSSTDIHVLNANFTLEGWFRLSASQADYNILSTYAEVASNTVGYIVRLTPTAFRFFAGKGGTFELADRTYSFLTGEWYHWAVTSESSVGRIFVNGSLQGSTFSTAGLVNSSIALQIGRTHTTTQDLNGYIDDLRITKAARYTANFTPPTAPFPDS